MGLAWSSIKVDKPKTSVAKHALLDWFKQALEILSNDMAVLNSSQSLLYKASSSSSSRFAHSDLDKQLNVKSTILGSYLNSIQQSMQAVKRSLRLIDVVSFDPKTGVHETIVDVDREYNMDKSIDWDKNDNNNEDDEESEKQSRSKNTVYELTFNDLTLLKDSGSQDQACNTIDKGFNDSKLAFLGW